MSIREWPRHFRCGVKDTGAPQGRAAALLEAAHEMLEDDDRVINHQADGGGHASSRASSC